MLFVKITQKAGSTHRAFEKGNQIVNSIAYPNDHNNCTHKAITLKREKIWAPVWMGPYESHEN